MRKKGRHKNDRLRAMRFAMWAANVPPHLLTVRQIGGLLDLHKTAASQWRADLLMALSPVEIEGVPSFLTPKPGNHFPTPAATGPTQQSEKQA